MSSRASAAPSLDTIAAALDADPDYRVLRRLTPIRRFHVLVSPPASSSLLVGAVVDAETTGLDRESDRIIELAVQRFRYDGDSRIVEVGYRWDAVMKYRWREVAHTETESE